MITYTRLIEKLEKQFQKALAFAFVGGGCVLLIMGLGAAYSNDVQVSTLLAGLSANTAFWLKLGGIASMVAGASMSYNFWHK